MAKTMEIIIPDGYEIDHENSSNYTIKFKKIGKPVDPIELLPKRWEDLGIIQGAFIDMASHIIGYQKLTSASNNKNVYPTNELAEAALALCQLLQLRDRWNGDWKADWKDEYMKTCIGNCKGVPTKIFSLDVSMPMTFATEKLCDKFLETFKDLLETAKPLL